MSFSEYFLVACFEEVIGNLGKKEENVLVMMPILCHFALSYDVAFSLWSQISHSCGKDSLKKIWLKIQ
jgi:hypothetical protein